MKRSKPLRRIPLKRTAMKRTRKTPRHQNPELQAEYRSENPDCEWAYWFPELETYIGRPVDMRKMMPPELNHIWRRRDDWSNFIRLSKYAHDWFHENLTAGRVLCMLVKCRKREDSVEFWEKASGHSNIRSWVKSLEVYYPVGDFMRPYWERLVDLLGKEQG